MQGDDGMMMQKQNYKQHYYRLNPPRYFICDHNHVGNSYGYNHDITR
jgi:hypothetical protein